MKQIASYCINISSRVKARAKTKNGHQEYYSNSNMLVTKECCKS